MNRRKPSKVRKNSALPLVRKFLKKMPQIAVRGTTKDMTKYEISGRVVWRKVFYTQKQSFKGSTRSAIKKLYNSVGTALMFSLGYSKADITFEADYQLQFQKPIQKPIIVLAINPEGKKGGTWKEKNSKLYSGVITIVRGSKETHTLPVDTGILVGGKKGKIVEIEVTDKDFKDCQTAWKERLATLKRIHATNLKLVGSQFAFDFLTRRVVQKALPHIQEAMKKPRARPNPQ